MFSRILFWYRQKDHFRSNPSQAVKIFTDTVIVNGFCHICVVNTSLSAPLVRVSLQKKLCFSVPHGFVLALCTVFADAQLL